MLQKHREALFDLLTLAIYADSHISLKEEALLESAFIAEGWDSEYPKSLFIDQSFARARAVAESEEETLQYLTERASVFTDKFSQTEACGVVKNVLERDGMAVAESKFFSLLEQAMPRIE